MNTSKKFLLNAIWLSLIIILIGFLSVNLPIEIKRNGVVVLGVIAMVFVIFKKIKRSEVKSDNYFDGDTGELEVEKNLKQLPDDYAVIPDLKKPFGGNIDFVVIGPTGVFALEVKYTKRHYNRFWKRDPAKQAMKNATSLGNYLRKELKDPYFFVKPVVVFNSKQYIKKKDSVRIISEDQLVSLLNEKNGEWLGSEKVEEISKTILKYG